MMLERDMDDIMSAKYMKNHIGDFFEGKITSITSFGIYITLENGIEGLAHVTSFPHYMVYIHETMSMIVEHTNFVYKIGQDVKVEVTDVDEVKGEIDFKVVKVII
jgi:ribonuclease R